MSSTMSVEIKARISPEKKAEIVQRAKRAGLSQSEFFRIASEGKNITILEEGKEIARKLCEIYTIFEACQAKAEFSTSSSSELSAKLADVCKAFNDIYEKLPAILLDEDDEDD